MSMRIKNMGKYGKIMKRGMDVGGAAVVLPLVVIITVVVSVLIWVFDGRPVFFRQERAGLNRKPFVLYKFRTMRRGIDPFGPSPKDGADDRLIPIGKVLRASSLDELPQFWNVLKGDMSLVGPRPLYMEQVEEWNDYQRQRLLVKPGLTGLAQIRGRGSLTVEEKLELDVEYVHKQSILFDLKIIWETGFSLFRAENIYEKRYSKDQETRG